MGIVPLRERLEHELKRTDIKLLAQIAIDDEEYELLCEHLRVRISRTNKLGREPDPMLAMGLVQIAVRAYVDGNYWRNFDKTIGCKPSSERRAEIGVIFRITLEHFNLCLVDLDDPHNRVVHNIKAHSFVQDAYADNYIEFLHSFYDRNLFRDLNDGVEADIHALMDYLKTTLAKNSDEIVVDAHGNTPAKTYRLLVATRKVMALCERDVITKMLLDHLKIVDAFYCAEQYQAEDKRLVGKIHDWLHSNVFDIQERKSQASAHRKPGSLFRKPHFEIDCETQKPALVIPEIKMRDVDLLGVTVARLSAGNNFSKQVMLTLYRSFGLVLSEPIRIDVDNIFEEFKLEIEADRSRLFVIPARPYRVFDNNLIETRKLRIGTNLIVVKKEYAFFADAAYVIKEASSEIWDMYQLIDVSDATIVRIGDDLLTANIVFIDGIVNDPANATYDAVFEGCPITVFTQHPKIRVLTPETLHATTRLVFEQQHILLNEIQVATEVCQAGEEPALCSTLDLRSYLQPESGHYRLLKDVPSKGMSKIAEYVLLAGFSIRFAEKRYILASHTIAEITCELPIRPINGRTLDTPHQYEFVIRNGATDAIIEVTLPTDKRILLYIPMPVFTYGITGREKYAEPLQYVWHEKLKNDFTVSLPKASDLRVGVNDENQEKELVRGKPQRDGSVRFDLSTLQGRLTSDERVKNSLILYYKDEDDGVNESQWKPFKVFHVLTGTHVIRNYFFVEDGQLKFFIDYMGVRSIRLQIAEKLDQETIHNIVDVKQGSNDLTVFHSIASYAVELIEVLDDGSGWGDGKTRHLFPPIENLLIIDPDDLSNCRIDLMRVYFDEIELPFRYDYAITDLHKIDRFTYRGRSLDCEVREKEKSKSHYPFLYDVLLSFEIAEYDITLKSIEIIDGDEQGDVYYDKNFRALRSPFCEEISEAYHRTRFKELYPDDVIFEIEVRRIS